MPPLGRSVTRGLGVAISMLAFTAEIPNADAQSTAPDVVILCDPAVFRAISDVGALWRQRSGVPVHVISSPTSLLIQQISHHIRSDFIIAEGDNSEAAATRQQLIKPGTQFGGWRNRLVVAERAPPSRADSPAPSSLAVLLQANSVAIVDAPVASAGAETRTALEALGLWDELQKQSIGVASTADAIFLLAQGTVKVAVVYATDVAANPSLAIAGTLADDSYAPITYWIAQTNAAVSPKADEFGLFLRQPEALRLLEADGLEVTP